MSLPDRPSDAELSRTLMSSRAFGALATMSIQCPGFPFGSLVGYAVDESGRPLLCLSGMAEHSRNMAVDPRASLLVTDHDDGGDPLDSARVTLVGQMSRLEGEERQACLGRYLAAHPGAYHTGFHDFAVYRLDVSDVRYVGGFARMSWLGAEQYAAAEPDPLLGSAEQIITHMNADHREALMAYCRAFAGLEPVSAMLVGVDRYGMEVLAEMAGDDKRSVRVEFTERADTAAAVREQAVALLRQAQVRRGG